MALIVSAEERKSHLPPAGPQQAVCFAVWDLGRQRGEWQGDIKIQHKIMIAWETESRIESDDVYDKQRYRIYKKYTLSLNENAALNKHLSAWRGKPFTDEEKKRFDLESLIGMNCFINIVHSEFNGKTYAQVAGLMPLPKSLPPLKPENPFETPGWVRKIQELAIGFKADPASPEEEIAF